jgi:MoaA/NifB/PqqE/SkfB family radical SAM enzyme
MFCDFCESEDLFILGVLGNTAHYRCRHCGADTSDTADHGTPEDDFYAEPGGYNDSDVSGAWGSDGYLDVMDEYDAD